METLKLILSIFQVIIAIGVIVVIVLQQSKQEGLSGAIVGSSETFFGKNKGRSFEAILNKVTIIGAVLLGVLTLVLNMI